MEPVAIAVALVLGFARAASPGPANAESIRRGRDGGGFRGAFLVQAGSLAGELGWAALAIVGLEMMLQDGTLRLVLAVVGGVLLVGLGLAALRYAATETGLPDIDPVVRRPGVGAFGTGVSFNGTSIAAPFVWLGIGSWLPRALPVGAGLGAAAGFIGLFALGWLAWAVVLGGLAGGFGKRITTGLIRVVDALAGLALAALGVLVLAGTLAR
ncbi:MAG TPA: LysE family transporter [Candidatus Limnocylindrales bacterium]|nr:LysE family transporter [Candidatus Limnocylindrales bacterium]